MAKRRKLSTAIKKVVRTTLEKKFFTPVDSSIPSAATWTFVHNIYQIIPGPLVANRIGAKINLLYIDWFITIVPRVTVDAAGGSSCRVIFWHDKDCRGTNPNASQIFQTDTYNNVRNPLYKSRYSIQAERTHNMTLISNNAGASFSTGPQAHIAYRQRCNKKIEFVGDTATLASLYKDNFGMAFASDGANCCDLTVKCNIYFTDD